MFTRNRRVINADAVQGITEILVSKGLLKDVSWVFQGRDCR